MSTLESTAEETLAFYKERLSHLEQEHEVCHAPPVVTTPACCSLAASHGNDSTVQTPHSLLFALTQTMYDRTTSSASRWSSRSRRSSTSRDIGSGSRCGEHGAAGSRARATRAAPRRAVCHTLPSTNVRTLPHPHPRLLRIDDTS